MLIRIERASSIPISRQIAEQIRAHCLGGAGQAGDRLPSVRELARELTVNQNTVLRVYDRLAAEGLIERRHGEGTFIASRSRSRRQHNEQLRQYRGELEQLARRGFMLGLEEAQLQGMFELAMKKATAGLTSPRPRQSDENKEHTT